jgi:hypothetical protein
MKRILWALILCIGLTTNAQARALLTTETTCSLGNVTVATTDETVIATQTVRIPQGNTFLVRVRVYFTMTTSADSSAYTIKARRDDIAGTVLGDAIAEAVKVTAGGVEMGYFEFTDERTGQFAALTYVSTLDMTGASDNTTVSQNCLTVDILQ